MGYGFNTHGATVYNPTPRNGVGMPKNYAEAAQAFEHADKRRGGARGKLCHSTTIERFLTRGADEFGIRLHDTVILLFRSDGSMVVNTGGWQTKTTRDRLNRCGVRLGMGGGVASVTHGGVEHVYRDGMTLLPDGTVLGYPTVGTVEQVRSRRRRALAAWNRANKGEGDFTSPPYGCAWYWPTRAGGWTNHRGNCPEAFQDDVQCGLAPAKR